MINPKKRLIKTIKEQVYQILRDDIINGKYLPGEIISEVDVAKALDVSRSPVHSAVTELIGEGLLESIPNKPVRVRELSDKQILDIFDYRCLIETFAIKRIIENLTPEVEKKLRFFRSEFGNYSDYKNIKKYIEVDSKFHQFLVDCSNNEIVADSFKNYSIMISPFRIISLTSTTRFSNSLIEHQTIIDFILKKDKDNACLEIKTHLKLAAIEIEHYLKEKKQ